MEETTTGKVAPTNPKTAATKTIATKTPTGKLTTGKTDIKATGKAVGPALTTATRGGKTTTTTTTQKGPQQTQGQTKPVQQTKLAQPIKTTETKSIKTALKK